MFDKLQIVFGSAVLFLFSACLNAQETCSSNSVLPFEWPGQRNWFIAPNLYSGVVINMETMGVTSVGGPGNSVTSYEGVSAASNDKVVLYQWKITVERNWKRRDKNVRRTFNW